MIGHICIAAFVIAGMPDMAAAQSPASNLSETTIDDADKLAQSGPIHDLKAMQIDDVQTVGNLHADDELLRRVADRLLRATYQGRYHVVVRDDEFLGAQPSSRSAAPIEMDATPNENKLKYEPSLPVHKPISPFWYMLIPAVSAFVLLLIVLRILGWALHKTKASHADNGESAPRRKPTASKRAAGRRHQK